MLRREELKGSLGKHCPAHVIPKTIHKEWDFFSTEYVSLITKYNPEFDPSNEANPGH